MDCISFTYMFRFEDYTEISYNAITLLFYIVLWYGWLTAHVSINLCNVPNLVFFALGRFRSFYSLQCETSYNALRCESTCSKSRLEPVTQETNLMFSYILMRLVWYCIQSNAKGFGEEINLSSTHSPNVDLFTVTR
jgi:hypothetical protein